MIASLQILVDKSVANRSRASGNLLITMPKVDPSNGPNALLAPPKNPLSKPPAARSGLTGIGLSKDGSARPGVIDLTNVVGAGRSRAAPGGAAMQKAAVKAGGDEGEDFVPAL